MLQHQTMPAVQGCGLGVQLGASRLHVHSVGCHCTASSMYMQAGSSAAYPNMCKSANTRYNINQGTHCQAGDGVAAALQLSCHMARKGTYTADCDMHQTPSTAIPAAHRREFDIKPFTEKQETHLHIKFNLNTVAHPLLTDTAAMRMRHA